MASFPEEIIADILSRLPTKSVMRFRCVCKPWSKLTSESTFIQMHFNRFTKKQIEKGEGLDLFLATKPESIHQDVTDGTVCLTHTHLYCGVEDKAIEIENPLEPSFNKTLVFGSCNGLVCLYNASGNRFCLLNPATREYKPFSITGDLDSVASASYGFGYSSVDDVYKLILFFRQNDDDGSKISIFPISDTIPPKNGSVPLNFLNKKESGILLDETLHWVAIHKDEVYPQVISFNLADNALEEFPRPDDVDKKAKISIGVLGGQLCMLSKYHTGEIEIWVMKNYGEVDSWTKLFVMGENVIPSIPLSKPYSYDGHVDKYLLNVRPLYFSNNAEVLITNGRDLVFYDYLKKEARNLDIHGIKDRANIKEVVTYIASLVTLKSGKYVQEEKRADEKWRNLRVHIKKRKRAQHPSLTSTGSESSDEVNIFLSCDKAAKS